MIERNILLEDNDNMLDGRRRGWRALRFESRRDSHHGGQAHWKATSLKDVHSQPLKWVCKELSLAGVCYGLLSKL